MSVLDQNPVHCQLVLIDDGSSDNSLKIMQQFAVQYEFIKLIHQENQRSLYADNPEKGEALWLEEFHTLIRQKYQ